VAGVGRNRPNRVETKNGGQSVQEAVASTEERPWETER